MWKARAYVVSLFSFFLKKLQLFFFLEIYPWILFIGSTTLTVAFRGLKDRRQMTKVRMKTAGQFVLGISTLAQLTLQLSLDTISQWVTAVLFLDFSN